jgi:hypothetical protein
VTLEPKIAPASEPKSASSLSAYMPLAAMIVGIGANFVWMLLLGYGLFALIEMAI